MSQAPDSDSFAGARRRMVAEQLRRRGIVDQEVLAAMEQVPRHRFVPKGSTDHAYGDHPLPIGDGQTISQPYMVARMTELAAPFSRQRALEVGVGSGYQTAVLRALGAEVWGTELVAVLATRAERRLEELGFDGVTVEARDGSLGWPEQGPFDIILVAAGAPAVPQPLLEQLADGGRLVIPVGGQYSQVLRRITRRGEELVERRDTPCRFVDLRGKHGWSGKR